MIDLTITKELIFQRILDEKKQLSFYGVKNIGLFGSFVRGDQAPMSDIDILVEFIPDKHTFDNFMEVAFFL
jgi:predicted nucleotidyltransferase